MINNIKSVSYHEKNGNGKNFWKNIWEFQTLFKKLYLYLSFSSNIKVIRYLSTKGYDTETQKDTGSEKR